MKKKNVIKVLKQLLTAIETWNESDDNDHIPDGGIFGDAYEAGVRLLEELDKPEKIKYWLMIKGSPVGILAKRELMRQYKRKGLLIKEKGSFY
jgi:hypothetical protein